MAVTYVATRNKRELSQILKSTVFTERGDDFEEQVVNKEGPAGASTVSYSLLQKINCVDNPIRRAH
jgi:hypothetical protein